MPSVSTVREKLHRGVVDYSSKKFTPREKKHTRESVFSTWFHIPEPKFICIGEFIVPDYGQFDKPKTLRQVFKRWLEELDYD